VAFVLEGEQCLVFYLGGIQTSAGGTNACLGFSPNNNNPAAPSAQGIRRRGPYFPFAPNRLLPLTAPPPIAAAPDLPKLAPTANSFFVYMDPWHAKFSPPAYGGSKPYAYFSTQGNNNGYTPNAAALLALGLVGECSSLQTAAAPPGLPTITVPQPWYNSPKHFVNPNGYQILSAGKDGWWGSGDFSGGSADNGPGHDDQANFSARILGSINQ
jgi:hypothetical protein